MVKDKIAELIEQKKSQLDNLKERSKASEDINELRALNEDIDILINELNKLKEMYGEMDEPVEMDRAANEEKSADSEEQNRGLKVVDMMETRKANEVEERAKAFATTGKLKIENNETRATLLSGGQIATPTKVAGINEPGTQFSSIVDMVTIEDMTGIGSYKEAYIDSWQTAGAATEGTASAPTDPVFKTVQINPFLLDTLSYVSREIRKQTPLQYEEKVRQGALIALRKKVAEWIVNGNGTAAPYGIKNAVNTDSSPASMTKTLSVTSATIDDKTLRKIVFEYGNDESIGTNAVLFLNKADLIAFGDVRGTNEKGAVYEIIPDGSNPNTGVIKEGGLTVKYCLNSNLTALSSSTRGSSAIQTMVYGDPSCYKLGLFGDYEVNVSEDYKFAEGLLAIRGEAMVGGNVVIKNGFVVVTLAATA